MHLKIYHYQEAFHKFHLYNLFLSPSLFQVASPLDINQELLKILSNSKNKEGSSKNRLDEFAKDSETGFSGSLDRIQTQR